MMPCEWPAIATGGVAVRSRPCRVSARIAAIWVSSMPGPEIGGGDQLLGGGQRLLGGQRADPLHRLEADRTHHDQLAGHRLEQQLGLTDQRRSARTRCPPRTDQLLQVLQPGAALAAERDGVGLAGVQPIDEGVCWPAGAPDGSSSRPVDTLSCSLIVTSCYLLGAALARIARRLWAVVVSAV